MTLNLKMILELDSRAAKAELEATAKAVKKLGDETSTLGGKGKTAATNTDALGTAARKTAANLNVLVTAEKSAAQGAVQIGQNAIVAAGHVGSIKTAFTGFGQMAASAAGTVAGSLLAIVNPANLLTGLVIGAGTAMVNWLFSAGKEAETLQTKIESLNGSIGAWRDESSTSAADLFKDFGQITPEIVAMQREITGLRIKEVLLDASDAAKTLSDELNGSILSLSSRTGNIADLLGVNSGGRGGQSAELQEISGLLDKLSTATGPREQLAVVQALRVAFGDAVGGIGNMNAEQTKFYSIVLDTEQAFRRAVVASGDVASGVTGASDKAAILEAATQAVKDALAAAAGINLSGVFSGAFGAADTLLGKVGAIIRGVAQANADLATQQANANAQLKQMAFGNSPGGQALSAYGGRTAGGTSEQKALETRNIRKVSPGSGTGSSGGASAAKAEADSLQGLIDKLHGEIDALRVQDPIQKEMLKYREALAGATDAERKQVEALIVAREKEALAVEGMKASKEFFEQTAVNALDALIEKGGNLQDVLKGVAAAFLKAAIQGALFGQGPFGAMFGGKSIFGGGGGGGFLAGLFGGKAEGGMIHGRGTGTSDSEVRALSVGEFVVNAKATARNRHTLEAINAGSSIPGLAGGGMVDSGRRRGSGSYGRDDRPTMVAHFSLAGARGDREIEAAAERGMKKALTQYDRGMLPASIKRVSGDPRRTG